ncbi:FadR/GntR family transcriptional regulator [Acidovorax sp. CCYZU-2555]|uniref:FadR/GntR family transcriptional regulator n=1 Tax=Acidovorax sp. CCYZU-2555 TaxID=2835042 RepID=UPI001BCB2AA3|nr:FadR/GntR family transcriptional regulator [Acidovorax sp. CCYZU-2555]MBS7777377.1 FadR family transcriptional regulator [Acidovorax sp. CCYZU-2555]
MSAIPRPNSRNISQPQRVVDGVVERIQAGALKPGDRVPTEPELMREFGVSRTVVREAMSRLQAAGLVATRQGVGTFVLDAVAQLQRPLLGLAARDVQVQQVLAMLELRISLESEAAHLAAQRRTPVHLAAMRAALDAFDAHRRAGASTTEDDFAFHVQIAVATGNEYFEEVLRNLGGATIPRPAQKPVEAANAGDTMARAPTFGAPLTPLEHNKLVTQREHEDIYLAIERQDAVAARAAMLMHLVHSRERLRTVCRET